MPLLNQAKPDAQSKTSSMKVCHLDRKGEISGSLRDFSSLSSSI